MADETKTEGAEAPKVAPGGADPKARVDELQRELADAIHRRKNAAAQADEYKARAEKLEAEQGSMREAYEAKLSAATGELAEARGAIRRKDFAEAVLAGVPYEHRSQAGLTLDGLILREKIDPATHENLEALAKATAERLRTAAPLLFQSQTTPPINGGGGTQAPPSPRDFSRYTSVDQVPKELMGSIPAADWERIKRGGAGKPRGF